jgi:nitroimidazol reductase NimA-like FMN-containing flavoprotein (pyridoxamine 5'-phosphate oxidase superfamily)
MDRVTVGSVANVQALGRDECLRRLATVTTGRLATSADALPVVHPIQFALVPGHIVFTLPPGSPLWRATAGRVIAFQADNSAAQGRATWSVLVQGVCREATTTIEAAQLEDLPLTRWHASGAHDHLMVLSVERISGERIEWGQAPLLRLREP